MTHKNDRDSVDVGALFIDGRVIAAAIATGVSAAFRRHKEAGVPAYVWRDGKVVELAPDQLPDRVTVTLPRTPVLRSKNRT
jgi:hypothetical protein